MRIVILLASIIFSYITGVSAKDIIQSKFPKNSTYYAEGRVRAPDTGTCTYDPSDPNSFANKAWNEVTEKLFRRFQSSNFFVDGGGESGCEGNVERASFFFLGEPKDAASVTAFLDHVKAVNETSFDHFQFKLVLVKEMTDYQSINLLDANNELLFVVNNDNDVSSVAQAKYLSHIDQIIAEASDPFIVFNHMSFDLSGDSLQTLRERVAFASQVRFEHKLKLQLDNGEAKDYLLSMNFRECGEKTPCLSAQR